MNYRGRTPTRVKEMLGGALILLSIGWLAYDLARFLFLQLG